MRAIYTARVVDTLTTLSETLRDRRAAPDLLKQLRRELQRCADERIQFAERHADLPLINCIEEAHEVLPALAALARRRYHSLPPGQVDHQPPFAPDNGVRGPVFGDRSVWEALKERDPPVWLRAVFDQVPRLTPSNEFTLISELCVRGAWDFADVLATEYAAQRMLGEWVGPLLRLHHVAFVDRYDTYGDVRYRRGLADPLVRLTADAHLAALDDDWAPFLAEVPVMQHQRVMFRPVDWFRN